MIVSCCRVKSVGPVAPVESEIWKKNSEPESALKVTGPKFELHPTGISVSALTKYTETIPGAGPNSCAASCTVPAVCDT